MADSKSIVKSYYMDYPEQPYISTNRDMDVFIKEVSKSKSKLVPKRNMERLDNGLLPGDIILLWRISHGNYTNETWTVKYFEYTYGIDAPAHLKKLINEGYVQQHAAIDSLKHLTSGDIKLFLKEKGVKNLSKMKRDELDNALKSNYTDEEVEKLFTVRSLSLTPKGDRALVEGQQVVDKHPKKPGY